MQLQLLTAIVKLFLKKPTETQELVQQVLSLATQVGAASLQCPSQPLVHPGSQTGSPAPNPQLRELSQTDRAGGDGGDVEPASHRGQGAEAGAGWPEGKPGGWAVSALCLKGQAPTSTQAVKLVTL